MNCPKCLKPMRVIKAVQAGNAGKTQHLECSNPKCGTTATAVTFMYNEDPKYGEGARKIAKQISEGALVPQLKKPRG